MPWHSPVLYAGRTEVLGDGTHAGMRWWVQRFEGDAHPIVTICGYDGPDYVSASAELPGGCEASVTVRVEVMVAEKRQARAKLAAKAAARREGAPA